MAVTLGSFSLVDPLGKGGMGEVWRGWHPTLQRHVAVKVDLHPPARAASAAFLQEVAIIAGLDHPNIGRVLEHGTVDEAAQEESRGRFRAGSRWLAMELAPGGTLKDMPPDTWDELKHVALGMLQGLAHAHARRVFHRDIKPANLLLAGPEVDIDTRPRTLQEARILLSDFGISERRDQPSTKTEDAVGTPTYMAPEQIEARWRDQGPWTDIYSVGVLLYQLATGSLPFSGRNAFMVFRGHLFTPPPPPTLRPGMPEGLSRVLLKCLEKDPEKRYAFAVEMIRDLEALEGRSEAVLPVDLEDLPTERVSSPSMAATLPGRVMTGGGGEQTGGLSLFGLRTPPLLGRQSETESLLAVLDRVRTQRTAEVVIVKGVQGLGRTRLCRWLCQVSHERGLGDHWIHTAGEGTPPGGGIRALVARELGIGGLEEEEILERLQVTLRSEHVDHRAVQRWLSEDGTRMPLRQQRALALAVLQASAAEQPLVVVFDDAHHDPDTLELADHLLALQQIRSRPLLVVLSVRSEVLLSRPEMAELLEELGEDDSVTTIDLQPLDASAQRRLSRALVGLDAGVAQRLESRTAGNPQFAVELVRSWVESGALTPTPKGYVLDADVEQTLPHDLRAIWAQRLDAVLGIRSLDDQRAIRVAACMGSFVASEAWEEACALLEIPIAPDLLEVMIRAGIVTGGEHGSSWRFAHGLAAEVLQQRAREGAWIPINLALAIQIQEAGVDDPERLSGHLLEAGELERAIDPLLQSILNRVDRQDLRDDSLFLRLEAALDELELEGHDPRRGRTAVLRAMVTRMQRGNDAADAILSEVERRFDPDTEIAALAMRERARLHYTKGDAEQALQAARDAQQAFSRLGQARRAADSLQLAGHLLLQLGRWTEAEQTLDAALASMAGQGWVSCHYDAMQGRAVLAQKQGRHDVAREWMDRLLEFTREHGMLASRGEIENLMGETARGQGDVERAAEHYKSAAEIFESLADQRYAFPLLNLAIMDIEAGRHSIAIERMRRLMVAMGTSPIPIVELYAQAVIFAGTAVMGDAELATATLPVVLAAVERFALIDGDLARLMEVGGAALAHLPVGAKALKVAGAQYTDLERFRDAARCAALAKAPSA